MKSCDIQVELRKFAFRTTFVLQRCGFRAGAAKMCFVHYFCDECSENSLPKVPPWGPRILFFAKLAVSGTRNFRQPSKNKSENTMQNRCSRDTLGPSTVVPTKQPWNRKRTPKKMMKPKPKRNLPRQDLGAKRRFSAQGFCLAKLQYGRKNTFPFCFSTLLTTHEFYTAKQGPTRRTTKKTIVRVKSCVLT